ncbi:hypothetical protein JK2ML_1604 [Mycobacterium leprae Kyoto-2]|uniref:Uncharacterized protein n=5 Tax=Mycobacterium leprae TaxID=1769 RepID=Q9CBT7_MYCLE|nr:hypothetical protein [Mycobacterium leprae]OAR21623.1 hypothetical protein A8144_05050 [Mycobacterium leprae 3125609]CAR71699.1 hypothetical protein MLBr01604 [Mycobacterium leprae Br4923]AWV48122.1 hypothetical protein DIJ64_08795 [Mycobacterium leprae]OAX71779.1 hypothetical protein A3216_03775 [Mycobacterium leprae 7935681]CAC30555.1 hypothetical protein [Mycobacterium leprae]
MVVAMSTRPLIVQVLASDAPADEVVPGTWRFTLALFLAQQLLRPIRGDAVISHFVRTVITMMATASAWAATDSAVVDLLLIEGGRPLQSDVRVGDFKHALVIVIESAVVWRAPVTIANCPEIEETRMLN